MAPKRGGRAVVLKQERGRAGNRVLALTQQRTMVRWTPDDFPGPIRRLANVELPRPFAPRSPSFQRAAVALLRRAARPSTRPTTTPTPASRSSRPRVHAHPLHGATGHRRRAARRLAGRPHRPRGRPPRAAHRGPHRDASPASSTACSRCSSRGATSTAGSCCRAAGCSSRLNTEGDLVVAEALRTGLLDGLDAAALDRGRLVLRVPAPRARQRRADAAAPLADPVVRQRGRRHRAHLAGPAASPSVTSACARPAGPIPGFTAAIHAWAEGDDLADILEDEEMTGGDFVRNVKQVIDLLRQIADVAPSPATAATARAAADACRRGVVAASSTVTCPPHRRRTAGDPARASRGGARRAAPPDLEVDGRRRRARRAPSPAAPGRARALPARRRRATWPGRSACAPA